MKVLKVLVVLAVLAVLQYNEFDFISLKFTIYQNGDPPSYPPTNNVKARDPVGSNNCLK